MKKRKRRAKEKRRVFETALKSMSEEAKRWQAMQDQAFAASFLCRVANFPPGVLLAAAVARPDGGIHNVVVGTDDLRRLAAFAMPQLGMSHTANRKGITP